MFSIPHHTFLPCKPLLLPSHSYSASCVASLFFKLFTFLLIAISSIPPTMFFGLSYPLTSFPFLIIYLLCDSALINSPYMTHHPNIFFPTTHPILNSIHIHPAFLHYRSSLVLPHTSEVAPAINLILCFLAILFVGQFWGS